MLQVIISTFLLFFKLSEFNFTDKHDSTALRKVAMAKLRKDRMILREPAFKGKLDQAFLIDLYEEIFL